MVFFRWLRRAGPRPGRTERPGGGRDVVLTFRVDPEGYVSAELSAPAPCEGEGKAALAHRVASGLRLLNDGRFLPTLEAAVGRCLSPEMAVGVLARMDAMAPVREPDFPRAGSEAPCVPPGEVFAGRPERNHDD